jgi:Ca2+-binding RTX toxin-like protein/endo-alpha-1,4-polygalactosaminidase (GH114 family)
MPTPNITNYALQYDNVVFDAIASSSMDLFITEGDQGDSDFIDPALTASQIGALRAAGRLVVGYVDTAVTDALRPYWQEEWTDTGNNGRDEDDLNHVSEVHAPAWLKDRPTNGFGVLVKFWDSAWQKIVIDQVKELKALGYSGVFLDDVAAYDDTFTEAERKTEQGKAAIGQNAFLMMQLVGAVREAVGPDFVIVANADPFMTTYTQYIPPSPEVTDAREAYFAAVDAYLLENPKSGDVTAAGINLPTGSPLLILQSLSPPRMAEAEAVRRGALYVAPDGKYDSLGRSPYPSTSSADILTGGDGPNRILGLPGDDRIDGGKGGDQLIGGTGADEMTGGTGDDLYEVDNVGDQVVEAASEGRDLVQSTISFTLGTNVENLTLIGVGATAAAGNTLANVLTGNGNSNLLNGAAGADTMAGGLGHDTYVVDQTGDKVMEAENAGVDTVQSSISFTLGANVENLTLTGIGTISATGNSLANVLSGNSNSNLLNGGLGADVMNGGLGHDTYVADNAGDKAVEAASAGTDTVHSSVGFTLGANVENLTLTGIGVINGTGNALANVLTGNGNSNRLDGGAGADTMTGGLGHDVYVVDNAGDKATEAANAGVDRVESSVTFTLGANVENLVLTGAAAVNGTGNTLANAITGNGAANLLKGEAGNDTIDGGGGGDRIHGGLGDDVLRGGAGADGFFFDTAPGPGNVDRLADFSVADDNIHLSRAVFAGIAANGPLAAGAFHAGTAAADAADRILYDSATGRIFYDADGSGAAAAILFATVTPGTALTNLDFVAY